MNTSQPSSHRLGSHASRRPAPLQSAALSLLLLLLLITGLLPALPLRAEPPSAPAGALPPGCFELVRQGGFETVTSDWFIVPSLLPGLFDNSRAFAGAFSMRLGNVNLSNVAADSRVEQTVNLPANANSIVLSFRYFGAIDGESIGVDDRQYLDIYDASTNQFLARPFEARNDDGIWLGAQYSLTSLRGRSIRLAFGTRNDGLDARIAMWIDEVSVYYCTTSPATHTPTPTPTHTPTGPPSLTPTFLPPATATSTLVPGTPGACTNILANGGFEAGGASWFFGQDPVPGVIVGTPRQEGQRAVQLGNPPNHRPDVESFSSVRQLVTIPANAGFAQLRWFAFYGTQEVQTDSIPPGGDRQEMVLLNPDLSTLAVPHRTRRNTGNFVQEVVDLTPFRGRSLYVYFNALNDGNGMRTWMFVDNVSLCTSAWAQPQPFDVNSQPPAYPTGAATGGYYPPQELYPTGQATGGYVPPNEIYPTGGETSGGTGGGTGGPVEAPTITPTPTTPAGDGAAAPGAAVVTLPPGPAVQPGEATPDMADPTAAATAEAFAQTLPDVMDIAATAQSSETQNSGAQSNLANLSSSTQEVAAQEIERTGPSVAGTVAVMCGILLLIGLLVVGVARVISGPRTGAGPGPVP